MLQDLIDKIIFLAMGGKNQEKKLMRCERYRSNSILKWKRQCGFGWTTTFKILNGLKIFDGEKIRQIIGKIISDNNVLFKRKKLFITSFGEEGKSGGVICYEFRHAKLIARSCFTKIFDIVKLPPNSTIIFVDDLIGTGNQSLNYINSKLNLLLSPSHNAILLTICATPEGIEKVTNNSNFEVLPGMVLNKDQYQYYSEDCNYFNPIEKEKIREINWKLKKALIPDYDLGLLIAFSYSTPNNTMPIIWKEGCEYITKNQKLENWFALLPR